MLRIGLVINFRLWRKCAWIFFCQICWKKKSCLYCPDVLDTDFILWEILLLREKLKKLQI